MSNFQSFQNYANAIRAVDLKDVARLEDLGKEYHFSAAPTYIAGIVSLINSIDPDNTDVIPPQVWREVNNLLGQVITIVEHITSFRPNQANPIAERDSIEQQLSDLHYQLFGRLSEISSATNLSSDLSAFRGAISQSQQALSEQVSQLLKGYEERTSEIENSAAKVLSEAKESAVSSSSAIRDLLEKTRNEAAEIITAREAEHFSNASVEFKDSAERWLKATVASVLVLIIGAMVFLVMASFGLYSKLDAVSGVQVGLAKLFLFGVLGYVAAQCAKNYFAAKHNEAVNRHRQNAILAYRALVEATGSPEHRDIVLTHAAAAVFAPQDTAFVKSAGASEIPPTFINSVTKAISPHPAN